MGSIAADAGKPHAVLVPFAAQGHVTPMLKLGKILHFWGFHVTFVNTEYNHRRLLRSRGAGALDGLPGFRFATIPDGLPPSDADVTQDGASLCRSVGTKIRRVGPTGRTPGGSLATPQKLAQEVRDSPHFYIGSTLPPQPMWD